MNKEINSLFDKNKICIIPKCIQEAYQKYLCETTTNKNTIKNKVVDYQNIIDAKNKIIEECEIKINMFIKFKKSGLLLPSEIVFCDEYQKNIFDICEYEKRHIKNYIDEHKKMLQILNNYIEPNIISLDEFINIYHHRFCINHYDDEQ
jgi:hypothetical protein